MIKKIFFSAILLLAWAVSGVAQDIPDKIRYCGIELTFTPGAKRKLAEYVNKMHESPRYFNQMVQRARMYIPFVEEAFLNVRVPQDLKYLTIQESALRSDVVSSSNAVGFWQFKLDAAIQYGLRVNDRVDERKHIYRSSEAAALYLANANRDFDNWIYALISYYEGLTGAVPYTDPQYYGKDQMKITEETHWYALKAIAHKIAYEEAINIPQQPEIFLEPISSEGETAVKALWEQHLLSEYEFLDYNTWILNTKKLPKENIFTYYIPRKGEFFTGHKPDPNKVNGGGAPTLLASAQSGMPVVRPELDGSQSNPPTSNPEISASPQPAMMKNEIPVSSGTYSSGPTDSYSPYSTSSGPSSPAVPDVYGPKAFPPSKLGTSSFVDFSLAHDLHYGIQYTLYDGDLMMPEMADLFGTRLSDLLMWNGLVPGREPPKGTIIYLAKPTRLEYHVVKQGESLGEIAAMRGTSIAHIQNRNRMRKNDMSIYHGQKLYLKKKRPKKEKTIILNWPDAQANTPPAPEGPVIIDTPPYQPTVKSENIPIPTSTANTSDKKTLEQFGPKDNGEIQDPQTRWIKHTVQPGETLWQISKKYGTKVEIIKMINKLTSDDIGEGLELRILSRD